MKQTATLFVAALLAAACTREEPETQISRAHDSRYVQDEPHVGAEPHEAKNAHGARPTRPQPATITPRVNGVTDPDVVSPTTGLGPQATPTPAPAPAAEPAAAPTHP